MRLARIPCVLTAGRLVLGVAVLSASEPSRAQRVAALPEDDRVWLTEFVAPIILPEEEKVFLQLTEAGQREGFREDFWQRRERPNLAPPLGPGYRDRYRELRQIVDAKYDGWNNDAGRLVLRQGEPDSIFRPRCEGEEVFRDLEVWTYGSLQLSGHPAARYIFYRPVAGAPRRFWMVHDSNASVFQPKACRQSFDRLALDCRPSPEDRCGRCADRCTVYEAWVEILKRQGSPAGALTEQAELFGYPKIPTEGLDRPRARWAAAAGAIAKTPAGTEPSKAAARTPTLVPTRTSTRQPTLVLTPTATRPPTLAATLTATRQPTPVPTSAPTRQPTPAPTPTATRERTPVPVPAATRPPTPAPTPTAARQPSVAPTPSATRPPTPVLSPTATRTPVPAMTPTATRPTLPPTPRPAAAVAPTPATTAGGERLRKLTPEEIRDRIETIEPEYKEFLDLARPLMSDEELSRFLQLSGHDKDAFIREFWKRHS